MKKRLTQNSLAVYATREIFTRKKAFAAIFFIFTVSLLILFNIFLFSYGSHLASVERAANDYHLRILNLTLQEVEQIQNLDYVSSVRAVPRTDSYVAYITLINDDPFSLQAQCRQILLDTGIDSFENFNYANWINEEYYRLTSTPHYMQNLPAFAFIFALSLIAVFFSMQIKTARTQKEYGYMLALGMTKNKIICITALQILIISLPAVVTSLAVAIPLLKIVSLFTEKAYFNSYPGVIFAIPWSNLFVIAALFIFFSLGFQVVSMKIVLRKETMSLIWERNTIYISYVQRSSPKFETSNKMLAYRSLHGKRNIRNRLVHLLKSVALFALPMILLLLSISYNESRVKTDDRDFFLSSADGIITEEIVSGLKNHAWIDEIVVRDKMTNGGYSCVDIYCKDGFEDKCGTLLEEIADDRGLLFANIYQNKIILTAQANFFAPYFLVQSLLMFLCALFIIGEDLRYELHTRRREFSTIRAIGYAVSDLKLLLRSYAWNGLAEFALSVVLLFLIIGYVSSIWISKWMLYPFLVIAGFGALDFFLHYTICNRYLTYIENVEISAVLSGQES